MSLANLIRKKGEPTRFATATPATFATQEGERGRTVASVATVAVAKSREEQSAPPQQAPETPARWWLLHFPDQNPREVFRSPHACLAEVLRDNPLAIAAEPLTDAARHPSVSLTEDDESAVKAWLVRIGETDQASVNDVLRQCESDPDALAYFVGRAGDQGADRGEDGYSVTTAPGKQEQDDRHRSTDCGNLTHGVCRVAAPGAAVSANRGYRPIAGVPVRCPGFLARGGAA